MKTTTFSLSLLAASAIALPIHPTARPQPQRRQIGVSIIGSTTIAAADASAFAAAAGVAAAGVTGGSGSSSDSSGGGGGGGGGYGGGEATQTSSAEGSQSTSGGSGSSDSGSGSGGSSGGSDSSAVDLTVLNFALTLEKLETEFYKKGLETFDKATMIQEGLSSTQADIVIQTFQQQATDEQSHVDFLKAGISALGGQEATGCSFDFSSVLSNPATFISAARTLELVGVSAYGGGATLISDPNLLTDAASILSIEARHQSALNVFSGGTFAAQSFDIPLAPEQVLSLAGGFLKGCSASDLGLSANQPLSAVNAKTGNTLISGNSQIAFASPVLNKDTDASKLTCQMIVGGQPTAIVQPLAQCQVPQNTNGPVMVFVTNDTQPLQANVNQQDKSTIVAGPAALFIDDGQESFQKLFSIDGFGIQQLASVDMGQLSMDASAGKSNPVDIIVQSDPSATNQKPVRDGMMYESENQKRGYVSPAGGKVLGWKL